MNLVFPSIATKENVFKIVEKHLEELGLIIIKKDMERPWGGFFVIDEDQSKLFIEKFFSEVNEFSLIAENKLSPKILIVEPAKRSSWQYHFRRSEVWRIIGGEVKIVTSETDEEKNIKNYRQGSIIELKKGERHRLIGLSGWGIVAEIWQHTDKNNPSNEEDIIRIQDDFGR
ncbi:MAG: phosphoheptose isomerase [Bacteroidota bacterium]|nr:phosphoheptose isomerase [Bacteroidota bacterium]